MAWWLFVGVFVLAGPMFLPAQAEPAALAPAPNPSEQMLFFDIAPQPLQAAIDAYSERTGLSVAYLAGLVAQRQSPGVGSPRFQCNK